MINKLVNNNVVLKIFTFFLALFTYVTFIKQEIIVSYNVLSLLFFILLIFLYNKYLLSFKKNIKVSLIISTVFSILEIFGRNFYAYYNNYTINIWKEIFAFKNLIYLIGLIPIFYIVINLIITKLTEYELKKNEKYNNKLFVVISLFLILGVWSIYLLTYYPGTLSPDSIGEYSMFVNGLHITSDHHPVIHTLFMALFYNIGYKISGIPNIGVLFVSIAQMIIMASIFVYSLVFLRKRGCPKIVSYIILLFYAFASMNGYYSITMWKDVLFAGLLLLLTIEFYKIFENKDKLTWKNMISFGIISLLTAFFRNNAIYAYTIMSIILLILMRKNIKLIGITILSVFAIFIFVKGPVFSWCNINKSSSSEYIGMPIQQIGRIVAKEELLTKNEYKMINKMIPIEIIPYVYNPVVSDGIKFNENFKIDEFNKNKSDYLSMYLHILSKHFPTAMEAYFISTLGYWYPNVIYWTVSNMTWDNDLGIYTDTKTNDSISNILQKGESRDLPLFGLQWSIGLCVWTILILTISFVIKNKKYEILPFLPCISIWITMLLASPVWGEFRYVYGLFTSLPFLIGIFFISNVRKTK